MLKIEPFEIFSTFFSILKASLSVYLYISLLRSSRRQRTRLCPSSGRPAPAHTEIHRTASSGLPSLAAFVLNTNSLSWTRPNAYQMRNKAAVVFTLIELHWCCKTKDGFASTKVFCTCLTGRRRRPHRGRVSPGHRTRWTRSCALLHSRDIPPSLGPHAL